MLRFVRPLAYASIGFLAALIVAPASGAAIGVFAAGFAAGFIVAFHE